MFRNVFAKVVAVSMILAASILAGSMTLSAQNKPISGTVTDASGVPVIGAAVFVVGNTSTGVMTDVDGKYNITVPSNAAVAVSCIGYATQTIQVGSESVYNVVLQEDTQLLEETVVVGYGVQKKSDLTGSVASVKSEDLANRSTSDAAAALQGKAAGVQILNNSGAPGEGAQIRVRGYSSNSANIGPLLIVDGLKVDNIQYLDPSMIESMEVLKDAASAAIYGAEAGNGVVLITTKTGDKGSASITYNGKFTLQMLGKKAELFNGPEYVQYQKELGNLNDDILKSNGYKEGMDYNWFDAVFAPSWAIQHGVTVQGGNNRGHYLTSINYVDNDGIVKGDKDVYNRLTAQVNADYKVFDWFTIGTTNSFEKWSRTSVSQSSYGSMLNSVMSLDPLTPAYYSNIEDTPTPFQQAYYEGKPVMRDPNHNNDFYATSKYVTEATGNPLAQRDRQDSKSEGINIRGSFFANLTPLKGLTVTSRFGYRINQSASHSYSAPYYLTGMANGGEYNLSANINTGYYYQWENFANFNRTFGKHDVSAMVGMSYIENNYDNASISASGTDILKGYDVNSRNLSNLLPTATKTVGNLPGQSTSMSYFGRIGYSYDNRYSVQVNFRADAFDASKLSPTNRWGYFPSVSAGWNISNESFIKDNVDKSVLSFLKLRGSWGRNGNVNILSGYPYMATISPNGLKYQYDPTNGETLQYGSAPSSVPNPDLTWETSEQIDLGLDARLLSDRLSITVDWYKKITKDLLVSYAPHPEVGVGSVYANAGNVLNSGFELELGWKDSFGDFHYSVNANMATLHNEVVSLHPALPRIEGQKGGVSGLNGHQRTSFEPGYPIWYFRGYDYVGVNPETGAPQYHNAAGEVVDNVEEGDLQYIGKSIPDMTYGLTINLAYKGFDFLLFGTGTVGNDIFSLLYSADRSTLNTLTHYWKNSWSEANKNALYPQMKKVHTDWKFWSSSASMFDGSYFKIKQIQLGYTLPRKFTKKFLVNNFRVYASLDDFFTFSSYPGCDPETATTGSHNNMGYDAGTYPTSKKVVFGVNITF